MDIYSVKRIVFFLLFFSAEWLSRMVMDGNEVHSSPQFKLSLVNPVIYKTLMNNNLINHWNKSFANTGVCNAECPGTAECQCLSFIHTGCLGTLRLILLSFYMPIGFD